MNASNGRILKSLALLVPVLLITAGCKSGPPIVRPVPWTVVITKTTTASIEVDLIGVTEKQKQFYAGLAMDAYWKSGSQVRKDADKISKALEKDKPWTLDSGDPQWAKWFSRGVTELLVVANLPEKRGHWQEALCLDKKCWKADKNTLEIEVQNTMVRVLTPQQVRN